MVFGTVLDQVDGGRRRLVFYNVKERGEHTERVIEYVSSHDVDLEYVDDPAEPNSTVAVEAGDRRLASDDVEQVSAYIDSWETALSTDRRPPSIFEALDETVFRSTNKRQLILASRLVETRAMRAGEGRLAAGFQQLSLARPQLTFYKQLPSTITVSLYGEPDWLPPADSGIEAYDPGVESHADYWWVLFDNTDTPSQHAALVAEENPDNTYTGFWTYRESLVEAISEIVDGFGAHRLVADE